MNEMNAWNAWQCFTQSGSVNDYLRYACIRNQGTGQKPPAGPEKELRNEQKTDYYNPGSCYPGTGRR